MRGRALLFANSRYGDSHLAELRSAPVDVGGLGAVLADPGIGAFQVETCVDVPGQAWRERLEEFFTDAARDELLFVYVSGHGVKDRDGRLYFAATDTKLGKLMSTGVAASFIQEASARSRSRRVVMIFDTCFSGAFAKGYQLKSGGTRVDSGQYFSEGGGKIVITASDDMQYAFAGDAVEGQPVPSVFTRHLIDGLRTGAADLNGDGTVTIDDLYRYVYDAVQRENPSQRPQQWTFGLSGDIAIATNPKPKPAQLPAQLIELLTHPNPGVRKTGAEELGRLLKSRDPRTAVAAREALQRLCEDDSRLVSGVASDALRGDPTSADAAPQPPPAPAQTRPEHAGAERAIEVEPPRERKAQRPPTGRTGDRRDPDSAAQRTARASSGHTVPSAASPNPWRLGAGVVGAITLVALGLMAMRWAMYSPHPAHIIPTVLYLTAGVSGLATLVAPDAWSRRVRRMAFLAIAGAGATALLGGMWPGAPGGYRIAVVEMLLILGAAIAVGLAMLARDGAEGRSAGAVRHPSSTGAPIDGES